MKLTTSLLLVAGLIGGLIAGNAVAPTRLLAAQQCPNIGCQGLACEMYGGASCSQVKNDAGQVTSCTAVECRLGY